ncbi:MAG: restriction endonuclease subunit S [Clostridia bacterium]|nr:restriction endonuclease subunit S [Clostridia bacterium]
MLEISYQVKNLKVSECFDYLSGNTGLTVRTIHNSRSEEFDCVVLSSSLVDDTSLGYIDSKTILPNGKELKLFKGKEGIVISRNGYAGTMSYLEPSIYTLTDHAYILFKKDRCKYDIDLHWFIFSFQKHIREKYLTTKSGNQTFVITKFMKEFVFDVPEINFQKDIAEKYKKINKQKEILVAQKKKINDFNLERITGYKIKEEKLFDIFEPHQGNAVFTKKTLIVKAGKVLYQ